MKVLLALLFSATASLLPAQTYAEARALIIAGDYEAAAMASAGLAARAPSESTYRLLALARSRQSQPGEAVWALRCATALGAPTERAMIVEEVYASLPPDLRPLPRRGVDALAGSLTRSAIPQLAPALALVCVLLLCGLLIARLNGRLFPPVGFAAGALVLLLAAAYSLWVAFRQNTLAHPAEAVVLAKAALREAPSDTAPELRDLPVGTVVTTDELLSGYLAATLPSGERGWVSEAVLRPVAPLAFGAP